MRNHVRTNKEINPAIMPDGWSSGKDASTAFTFYPSAEEREAIMAKFSVYRDRVYASEVLCFLLSNYIASEQGKTYSPIAMEIWSYRKEYVKPKGGYAHYTIGSIPVTFRKMVRTQLKQLSFQYADRLVYYAVSAFYQAPYSLIEKLCATIERLKHPVVRVEKFLVLQTELPDKDFQLIKEYSASTGMSICELMRTVLKTVCLSKREREEDCSAIARLFNLYRIMEQPGHPFSATNGATLNILVLDEHDRKYLLKFIKRRGLSRKELLRKAVRALMHVISNKSRFERRIQYTPEAIADEEDYYYERLSKMDFTRNVYAYK